MSAPYYSDEAVTLWHGDALAVLRSLPDESVNCCVTSPPYFGLRDYGEKGQYGLESSPAEYVETMRAVFAEVRRVLAADGTLWLNLGDSYSGPLTGQPPTNTRNKGGHVKRPATGLPPKNLQGIPWRVAFALQDAVRAPHSEASIARYSRPVVFTSGHPSSASVGQAGNAIAAGHAPERGVNPGDVWAMPTQPFTEAHFAVMPAALAERAVLAGCKPNGVVLDPFSGSGTTGLAAAKHGRRYVGIDLNADYLDLSLRTRLGQTALLDGETA